MQSNAKTVASYLKSLPEDRRKALVKIRTLVRQAFPQASEGMQYGMPIFHWRGQPVFAFASQAHYLSLYICDAVLVREFKPRLGKVSCGKGCIRFRKLDDMPLDVAGDLLRKAAQRVRSGEYVYAGHSRKKEELSNQRAGAR